MSDMSQDFEIAKQLAAAYEAPPEAIELINETDVLLVVGVTASGKNTIIEHLLETDHYSYIVSHTTRDPRTNHGELEKNGQDYFFVDEAEMGRLIKDHAFIEAKLVHDRDIYGTSIEQIQKAHDLGRVAVTDIDVQGVAEYKQLSDKVKAVFIVPPSFEEWSKRILKRPGEHGTDATDLQKRLSAAVDEFEHALETDYFEFVINDDIEEAVHRVEAIVRGDTDADHAKAGRKLAEDILVELKYALQNA